MESVIKLQKVRVEECVLIIGMHRSGTSLIARYIHDLGYSIGDDIMSPSFDNPEGFYENNLIVELNNSILKKFGSTWDRPLFTLENVLTPEIESTFTQEFQRIFRNEFADTSRILIKDPRISLLGVGK